MITGRVFFLFLKGIFSGLLNVGSNEWKVAGKELISKNTFRLPDYSYSDRLIGLRTLRRTFKNLTTKRKIELSNHAVLILDSRSVVYDLRKEYVIKIKGYKEEEIAAITKDYAADYASVWPCRIYLFFLSLIILPATFFSKNRVQWSLIFTEFVEVSAVANGAAKMNVKNIHYFCPAEKDANLAYLILKNEKYRITKHPSPGALVSHNKYLMADVLALSGKYQKEEYEIKLKETIKVAETETWPPESSLEYADMYKDKTFDFEFRIGFYSHGGWCRVKDGKTNGLFAKAEEEEKCLTILSEFLKLNREDKIIIFLHPKEKKNLRETEEYYGRWFKKEQLSFYTDSLPSSYAFNKVEIGVGSYSTILFERDYFGFKTLLMREEERDFPLKGTKFYLNSFISAAELNEKIKNYTN